MARRRSLLLVLAWFAISSLGVAPATAGTGGVVVAAAGDIACVVPCSSQRATARQIASIDPDAVFTLGDNQYERGRLGEFRASYDITWGAFLDRTFPSPGNHEYLTPRARGYFRYFGDVAHRPRGFYAFELGGWQILSMNSEHLIDRQTTWVRERLEESDATCQLAFWHRTRWTSSVEHVGEALKLRPWWRELYRAGVDVVLAGHQHHYERFGRMTPEGRLSPEGIRQFVVGTGGIDRLYKFGDPHRGSQERIRAHGVLRLALRPNEYSWRFRGIGSRDDAGTTDCH